MSALVLGSGDDGTTPSLLLQHRDHRLLINASEALQRLSCEHHLKLHRGLDGILLSSLEPTAVAVYDCIKGAEMMAGGDPESEHWKTVRQGLDWFIEHYPEAYTKLLD